MPKYITRKVTKFSFVMPVFDNDIRDTEDGYYDLMIPCEDRHMVEYHVFGWQYLSQRWKKIDYAGYYEEAKEIADKYDKKMVKRLEIYCDDMGDKKGYEDEVSIQDKIPRA